jgi:hypothetical protein
MKASRRAPFFSGFHYHCGFQDTNMNPSFADQGKPTSVMDKEFLEPVESWLKFQLEIFVLFRYSHAAGNKDFEIISSFTDFNNRLRLLAPSTSVTVFKQRQLALRGVVDDPFIAQCVNIVPDKTEFLLLDTKARTGGGHSWFHHVAGESHFELREALEELRGSYVAAGSYPQLRDSSNVISGIVPDKNGAVIVGAY